MLKTDKSQVSSILLNYDHHFCLFTPYSKEMGRAIKLCAEEGAQ